MSGQADEQLELLKIAQGLQSHLKDSPTVGSQWPRGNSGRPSRAKYGDMIPSEIGGHDPNLRNQIGSCPPISEFSGHVPVFRTEPALESYHELASLNAAIKDCVKCPLGKTRTKFVFGEGNPQAKLMFIGEGPGRDEDLQGRPFVGRAGQLLTKIIEAMGYRRADVYIANLIKCRPPNNRPPEPQEIEKCWPHLAAQIRLIKPKVICALGSYAARTLLGTDLPIGSLRGRFQEADGIPIMPTYHPAYLLRNPNDKGKVWEDVKQVRDLLKTL